MKTETDVYVVYAKYFVGCLLDFYVR